MAVLFEDLKTDLGLKQLDEYLLTRSYISGYEASKDDLAVYSAIDKVPAKYTNASRWYSHIQNLLGSRFAGASAGVNIGGAASSSAPKSVAVPDPDVASAAAVQAEEEEDDDDDLDLFAGPTEEEKKASEARKAAAAAAGKTKEAGKSSVLIDIKPWDDETDMAELEKAVRSVQMEGLTWGASKLVPVGYGIKKLTMMMTIVDDLVSVDGLIEDHLTSGSCEQYIQSCDIVAFNKI